MGMAGHRTLAPLFICIVCSVCNAQAVSIGFCSDGGTLYDTCPDGEFCTDHIGGTCKPCMVCADMDVARGFSLKCLCSGTDPFAICDIPEYPSWPLLTLEDVRTSRVPELEFLFNGTAAKRYCPTVTTVPPSVVTESPSALPTMSSLTTSNFIPPPIAYKVPCNDTGPIDNGSYAVTNTSEGGMASFTCDEGYTLVGKNVSVCREDGSWSADKPSCAVCFVPTAANKMSRCDDPGSPAHGFRIEMDPSPSGTARFGCDESFKLRGPEKIECTESGWSDAVPACEPEGININDTYGRDYYTMLEEGEVPTESNDTRTKNVSGL